jgi:hypothetical protein
MVVFNTGFAREHPMPQINVSDDTFRRLALKAAALNVSVDDLVQPALDRIAEKSAPDSESVLQLTGDAWRTEVDAWKEDAHSRAGRYPAGFVLDDSRERSYREREDAQLGNGLTSPGFRA